MKSSLSVMLFFLINTVYGQAADFLDVKHLNPVFNWSQARNECFGLGDNWDLPSVEQALSETFSSKIVNQLKTRDLKSQKIKNFLLVWAKSSEEELNQQFLEASQLLKIDSESKKIDSYPMSELRVQYIGNYLRDLIENRSNISRTSADHVKLLDFLEDYRSTEVGMIYNIDEDIPMSEQSEYVLMLPESVLPQEILMILSKPSARYVQTLIDNMKFEYGSIGKGVEVICIKSKN